MNDDKFKFIVRAFITSQLAIFTVLVTEILTIQYIMAHDTILDVINNFVKMKIISQFDDFCMHPYKHTSMAKFMGINIKIDTFRKTKVYVTTS